METRAVLVQTLCIPCACRCRYCLLSWDGRTLGADWDRSAAWAVNFAAYLRENRPELRFDFYFGYSMDHPALFAALDFLNALGSTQGRFLQLDGLRMRTEDESRALMAGLAAHGVERVNFTFYGLREYHDRFAARAGDFDYLLRLAAAAGEAGLETGAGVPLTAENAAQADALLVLLSRAGIGSVRLFVPHEEGRGACLAKVRITERELAALGPQSRALLDRSVYRTEGEWVRCAPELPSEQNRALLLSLTPETLARFEAMPFADVIREVEALDDAYYGALPDFAALCARYGDPDGPALYGRRDLFQHFQRRYIRENGLSLCDVTDERRCGSRRY